MWRVVVTLAALACGGDVDVSQCEVPITPPVSVPALDGVHQVIPSFQARYATATTFTAGGVSGDIDVLDVVLSDVAAACPTSWLEPNHSPIRSDVQFIVLDLTVPTKSEFVAIYDVSTAASSNAFVIGGRLQSGHTTGDGSGDGEDASAGTVTISEFVANDHVTGQFEVTFKNGTVSGTFTAPFCLAPCRTK